MRVCCPSLLCVLSIVVCGVVAVGCESDNDDKPMTEEQAEAEIEDVSLFGTWKGIAGTGQVNVTLELVPGNTGFSGNPDANGHLTWPGGDVRRVWGWYQDGNHNRVQLLTETEWGIGDEDVWNLTIQGNTMTGVGTKRGREGGGTYAVSLTKR